MLESIRASIVRGIALVGARWLPATALLCTVAGTAHSQDLAREVEFNIPPQSLSAAVIAFSDQSGIQIVTSGTDVSKLSTPGVSGRLSISDGLNRLLSGTQLRFAAVGASTVALTSKPADSAHAAAPEGKERPLALAQAQGESASVESQSTKGGSPRVDSQRERSRDAVELEEIVVTGTHLRSNVNLAAPVYVYSREDIARTGATNVQQLLELIPQNARDSDSGSSPDGLFGGGNLALVNLSRAAGPNLRGLGAGSTLTLINGKRLAASAGGTVVDLNMIPLSVIERVDILADGGSAIYGADAVGGVVNVILRRRFEGVEALGEYKTDDGNDYAERRGGLTVGLNGERYHALFAGNVGSTTDLLASDRDFTHLPVFTDAQGNAVVPQLYPKTSDKTLFATAAVDIGAATALDVDVLYGDRSSDQARTDISAGSPRIFILNSTTKMLSSRAALSQDFSGGWNANVNAGYYRTKVPARQQILQLSLPTNDQRLPYDNHGFDAQGIVKGGFDLFANHPLQIAAGAEYRNEDYEALIDRVSPLPPPPVQRRVVHQNASSAFTELSAPLLPGSEEAHSGALVLTLAGRFDRYDVSKVASVNNRTTATDNEYNTLNPQIGIVWKPASWLKLRGNYNTSFKPASPFIVAGEGVNDILFSFNVKSPSGGTSKVLLYSGTARDIQPEKSTNFSAGLDIAPWAGSWSSSLTYFHYRYHDRISDPSSSLSADILLQPAFGSLVHAMDAQEVAYVNSLLPVPLNFISGTVESHQYFVDLRTRNIAVQVVDGLDASLQKRMPLPKGTLELALTSTYLFTDERHITSAAPAIEVLNTPFNNSKLRARNSVTWVLPAASLTFAANYVDNYESKLPLSGPVQVASWSTFDLSGRMMIPGKQHVELGLSVINMFDRDPPFMTCATTFCVNYDTSKANPLGRLFTASATARF